MGGWREGRVRCVWGVEEGETPMRSGGVGCDGVRRDDDECGCDGVRVVRRACGIYAPATRVMPMLAARPALRARVPVSDRPCGSGR